MAYQDNRNRKNAVQPPEIKARPYAYNAGDYDPEIAERLVVLAEELGVKKACERLSVSRNAVGAWRMKAEHVVAGGVPFDHALLEAERRRCEAFVDEGRELAIEIEKKLGENTKINHQWISAARVKLHWIQWEASKLLTRFGDKVVHSGDRDNPIVSVKVVEFRNADSGTLIEGARAERSLPPQEEP